MPLCILCSGVGTWRGLAPHKHTLNSLDRISGTLFEPREKWPDNFTQDGDEYGVGTYVCSHCKGTGDEPGEKGE